MQAYIEKNTTEHGFILAKYIFVQLSIFYKLKLKAKYLLKFYTMHEKKLYGKIIYENMKNKNNECLKVKVKLLRRVQLFATLWTHQAPSSMGFSRQ